jgi:hypothetical protein
MNVKCQCLGHLADTIVFAALRQDEGASLKTLMDGLRYLDEAGDRPGRTVVLMEETHPKHSFYFDIQEDGHRVFNGGLIWHEESNKWELHS